MPAQKRRGTRDTVDAFQAEGKECSEVDRRELFFPAEYALSEGLLRERWLFGAADRPLYEAVNE